MEQLPVTQYYLVGMLISLLIAVWLQKIYGMSFANYFQHGLQEGDQSFQGTPENSQMKYNYPTPSHCNPGTVAFDNAAPGIHDTDLQWPGFPFATSSSCQVGYSFERQFIDPPVLPKRDHTRSPLRKKPHIRRENDGVPQGSIVVQPQAHPKSEDPEINESCNIRNRKTPSPPTKELTMADLLLSGKIPFAPLERPNTEAARIFYNAPDIPPILPIDPKSWSVAELMLWLRWCSRKYDIPNIDPHMFGFNGKALCVMTKSMFEYRVPKGNGALILYTEIKNRKKHAAVQRKANELRQRQKKDSQRRRT